MKQRHKENSLGKYNIHQMGSGGVRPGTKKQRVNNSSNCLLA